MIFKQLDINLDRFKYTVEKDGVSVTKRRLFSVSKQFFAFEKVGSEVIRYKERKLVWLSISLFFFIIAMTVFAWRLNGDRKVGDSAEMFWFTISLLFLIVYALTRKNNAFLVKDNTEHRIEFIGTKIYEKRLNKFISELLQKRDEYLSSKYASFNGLTLDENIFCANAEIQIRDGLLLKELTYHSLEQLIFEDEYSDVRKPQGIRSLTTEKNARKILKEYQDQLIGEGKYIFISEFSADECYIGLIGNTSDPFKIMRCAGTNGANDNIDTEDIIVKCRQWDEAFGIKLTGIGLDFCELEIKGKDIDYKKLALETYKFCPDVVEQGTGTVERLENEMKETRRIFLWWD